MVRVKICGITNVEDALAAARYGADALGFIFASSPRQVSPGQATEIIRKLPPFVHAVGVFVDADAAWVRNIVDVCNLDYVQLHGSESPDYCRAFLPRVIKAFQVANEDVLARLSEYSVTAYLLDAYHSGLAGGTGRTFDWTIAARAQKLGPTILSGGLTPQNVAQAILQVRPLAVDVSSGVETMPGRKDHQKLRAFIAAAKAQEVND